MCIYLHKIAIGHLDLMKNISLWHSSANSKSTPTLGMVIRILCPDSHTSVSIRFEMKTMGLTN